MFETGVDMTGWNFINEVKNIKMLKSQWKYFLSNLCHCACKRAGVRQWKRKLQTLLGHKSNWNKWFTRTDRRCACLFKVFAELVAPKTPPVGRADLRPKPLMCVFLPSVTNAYPFVVNAAEASVQVRQMCQQGPDGSQSVRVGLQDLLHSSLSLQDAPADQRAEG